MALAPLFEKFDRCMKDDDWSPERSCEDCPLLKEVRLRIGDTHDEHGGLTWRIQACSLMAILDKSLARRKYAERNTVPPG